MSKQRAMSAERERKPNDGAVSTHIVEPPAAGPAARLKPEDVARNNEIVELLSAGLAVRLRSHVRRKLEEEAQTEELTQDWIDDAYHALLAELSEEEGQEIEALAEARIQAIESLGHSMALDLVSDAEVESHVKSVARCMVSNWLSLIRSSHERQQLQGHPLLLDNAFLPRSYSDSDVSSLGKLKMGFSAYAADPEEVLREWQAHLAYECAQQFYLPLISKLALTKEEGGYRVAPESDRLVREIATVVLKSPNDPLPGDSGTLNRELNAEFEVVAARVAAAWVGAGQSKELIWGEKFENWAVIEPKLVSDWAEYIIEDLNELADDQANGKPKSNPQLLNLQAQLKQRFSARVASEPASWRRAYRITKMATALATAAQNGDLELQMQTEHTNLERYRQDPTSGVVKLSRDGNIVVMALDVASRAVDLLRARGKQMKMLSLVSR